MGRLRLTLLATLVALSACGRGEAERRCRLEADRINASSKEITERLSQTRLNTIYDKVAVRNSETMTPQAYPKTYEALGKEAFSRANDLVPWAGVVLIEQRICDDVDNVMVSDRSLPTSLVFFGNCLGSDEVHHISEIEALAVQRAAKRGERAKPPPVEPLGARWIRHCVEQADE